MKFIKFGDGPSDAILVNNAAWLDGINYLDFLRNYGRHFSINRMLAFESVKQRLAREQPLSFLEFNYMLLQAYVRCDGDEMMEIDALLSAVSPGLCGAASPFQGPAAARRV